MNNQQAYEMMRVYLTRPGARRATDSHGVGCAYETRIEGETHRCAVGCILSPAAISELQQNGALTGAGILVITDTKAGRPLFPTVFGELANLDSDFLGTAQSLHDDRRMWRGGKFRVRIFDRIICNQFGLEPVVDEPEQEASAPASVLAFA